METDTAASRLLLHPSLASDLACCCCAPPFLLTTLYPPGAVRSYSPPALAWKEEATLVLGQRPWRPALMEARPTPMGTNVMWNNAG